MRDYVFSDGQDLSTAVAGTGVVSSNVYDMELTADGGDTIIENDQIVGWLNFIILATTNTGASGGLDVELRSADNSDIETSDTPIAKIHVANAAIAAGLKRSIKVIASLTQKFLGIFYMPITSDLTGATTVDCWMDIGPITDNDSIQKVPS